MIPSFPLPSPLLVSFIFFLPSSILFLFFLLSSHPRLNSCQFVCCTCEPCRASAASLHLHHNPSPHLPLSPLPTGKMAANKSSAIDDQEPVDVLIALHHKFDLLDFAGPMQVLTSAAHNFSDPGTSRCPRPRPRPCPSARSSSPRFPPRPLTNLTNHACRAPC